MNERYHFVVSSDDGLFVCSAFSAAGVDPPAPPAVRGGPPHPQHLPHAGGRDQLLPASEQRHAHRLQDQHPAGLHPLPGQPDGRTARHSGQYSTHRCDISPLPPVSLIVLVLFPFFLVPIVFILYMCKLTVLGVRVTLFVTVFASTKEIKMTLE